MRRQVHPASRFAELCEVADIGQKARRAAAQGAKADKPDRYDPRHRLQDPQANRRTFAAAAPEAADGAMVLNCLPAHFGHPARGVLRYETSVSAAEADSKVVTALSEHLTRAHDASLPVRMVVTFPDGGKTGKGGSYHVRPDLTGKIVEFDGDRFVIDFTRPQVASPALTGRRK